MAPAIKDRNGLDSYFAQICTTPLLTPKEEIALARRIKKGDAVAYKQMVAANLRLVVKIANSYHSGPLSLAEMISEGNLGLIKAVGRFDPTRGAKLSTYAAWWIKQHIQLALTAARTIRLPSYIMPRLIALSRATRELKEKLGRNPEPEEIAAELKIPLKRVITLQLTNQHVLSLDAPLSTETGFTVGDTIPDPTAHDPRDTLGVTTRHAHLHQLLDEMADQRDAEVLRARFGLGHRSACTLEVVGKRLKITRERVRQLEVKAIKHLRLKLRNNDAQLTRTEADLGKLLKAANKRSTSRRSPRK